MSSSSWWIHLRSNNNNHFVIENVMRIYHYIAHNANNPTQNIHSTRSTIHIRQMGIYVIHYWICELRVTSYEAHSHYYYTFLQMMNTKYMHTKLAVVIVHTQKLFNNKRRKRRRKRRSEESMCAWDAATRYGL